MPEKTNVFRFLQIRSFCCRNTFVFEGKYIRITRKRYGISFQTYRISSKSNGVSFKRYTVSFEKYTYNFYPEFCILNCHNCHLLYNHLFINTLSVTITLFSIVTQLSPININCHLSSSYLFIPHLSSYYFVFQLPYCNTLKKSHYTATKQRLILLQFAWQLVWQFIQLP